MAWVEGFEPPASGFGDQRSTTELHPIREKPLGEGFEPPTRASHLVGLALLYLTELSHKAPDAPASLCPDINA